MDADPNNRWVLLSLVGIDVRLARQLGKVMHPVRGEIHFYV